MKYVTYEGPWLMEISLTASIFIFSSAFLVGFSKTSAGGVGLLIVVFMTAAFPAKVSLGILIPMLFFADIIAVITYRRHCDWEALLRIFPTTAIGIILGYFLVSYLPQDIFLSTLGAIVIGLVALELVVEKRELNLYGKKTFAVFVGLLAGISSMMANAAGPLLSMYLLSMRLPKERFVGTRSWFFLLVNAFKIPLALNLGLVTADTLRIDLMYSPAIIAGAIMGWFATRTISVAGFKWWIRGVSVIAGAKFIFF